MHVQFLGESDDGTCVSSHHARALASSGVDTSFDAPSASPQSPSTRPDVIHLVTFEQSSNALLRQLVAARMAGTPIVRYWTGRDVVWAREHGPSQDFARAIAGMGATQLCRSPELAEQLGAIGLTARVLPVISSNISGTASPQALPRTFSVLCHLPAARREFHGGPLIDALIGRLPAVRFLVLGGGGASLAERPNVEWLHDRTDCVRAIQRSTIVVDARVDAGLSRLVLEALCHGRHVATGYPLPHAHIAHSLDDFVEAIRRVRVEPTFNLEGRTYVNREHEQHGAIKALRRELEDAIQPGRLNLVLEGGFRGATTTFQNLHVLSPREFPFPEPESLSDQARALRSLIRDMQQADQGAAV